MIIHKLVLSNQSYSILSRCNCQELTEPFFQNFGELVELQRLRNMFIHACCLCSFHVLQEKKILSTVESVVLLLQDIIARLFYY